MYTCILLKQDFGNIYSRQDKIDRNKRDILNNVLHFEP